MGLAFLFDNFTAMSTAAEVVLLTENGTFKHKVSSVLNGSAEFASKHMFDESQDMCWNSDQGLPQFVMIDFTRLVQVRSIHIMFQGGFVGQEGIVEGGVSLADMQPLKSIPYIEDSNDMHEFAFDQENCEKSIRYLKITFYQSTDFYGRITIYSMKVFGCNV